MCVVRGCPGIASKFAIFLLSGETIVLKAKWGLIYAIVAGSLTGYFIPEINVYAGVIPYLIGIILFINFAGLEMSIRSFIRPAIFIGPFLNFAIVPYLVSITIVPLFKSDYAAGLILISCAPSGIMTVILAPLFPERYHLMLAGNFFLSTALSIIGMPLVIDWILGESFSLDAVSIFEKTAWIVLTPLFFAIILNRLFSRRRVLRMRKGLSSVMPIFVFTVIAISIAGASNSLHSGGDIILVSLAVLGVFTIAGIAGFVAGLVLPVSEPAGMIAFMTSSRNVQLSLAIAATSFSPLTSLTVVLSILIHHFTNLFYVTVIRSAQRLK